MTNFGIIGNLAQLLSMAKQNPHQAVITLLQQGMQNGKINQQQYNLLSTQLQNGANPNTIIQQMMNNGMVNQQMYEDARRNMSEKNFVKKFDVSNLKSK